LVGAFIVMRGDANLLDVVGTFGPIGSLAHLLYGRQQQPDQHADDGDDDEKFDESERMTNERSRFHNPSCNWGITGRYDAERGRMGRGAGPENKSNSRTAGSDPRKLGRLTPFLIACYDSVGLIVSIREVGFDCLQTRRG